MHTSTCITAYIAIVNWYDPITKEKESATTGHIQLHRLSVVVKCFQSKLYTHSYIATNNTALRAGAHIRVYAVWLGTHLTKKTWQMDVVDPKFNNMDACKAWLHACI